MRITRLIAVAGVSMVALSGTSVWAQAADEEGYSSDDIIVEARRKDESLQDVPLTVNAVTSEAIQKLNIRDLKDITGVVPGLVLNSGNRTTGAITSLRGLNVDVNSSGNSGTVEFYLNDAPVSAGVVLQSMFDVGQVEVLRGPQGTLRGRASPSGSITVTSKRPDMEEWGGYAQSTVNNLNTVNLQGAINAPLIPGVLAVRLAGLMDNNEGSRVRSINNPSFEPNAKTRGIRVTVSANPIEGLELDFTYGHLVKNSIVWDQVESAGLATGGAIVGTLLTAADRKAVSNVPNDNHQAFDVFNWQAQYSVLGQRLNYVGSFTKQDFRSTEPTDKVDYFDNTWPGDASLSNNNQTYATFATGLNLQNLAQASHSFTKMETHELRLSSEERLFGMVDYVVGGFVQKLTPWTDLISVGSANVNPVTKTVVSLTPSPIARRGRTLERAFFGNLTFHLGEATELSGGARHINYKSNTNYSSAAVPYSPRNDEFNAWVWSVSLKHRFNEDLMVYANAGSSFRVGSGTNPLILGRTVNPANAIDPFLQSLLLITPERSKSYEIGVRSTWLDRKLTVNISAFHQDFTGYIFPVSPFFVRDYNPGTSTYGPAALTISTIAAPVPAKVDGIEAEFALRPMDGLSLGATIAYAKAKMSNATVPCAPPIQPGVTEQVAKCTVNQSAGRISPFTASLQGEYSRPISDSMSGFIRGLMSIYGNSGNDPQNPYDRVPSYALANLYLGVRDQDNAWEVSVYAKNLFDTLRVTDRFSTTAVTSRVNGTTASGNYRLINTTDPREFGITARFAFGSR